MPGLFITFEGLDGSGKSTHLRRISRWLGAAGVAHEATHEPGGTPLGEGIRRLFLDPSWGRLDGTVEVLLLFASRRQHLLEVIEPALAAGRHVLCDRFTDSTVAYQGYGRGVSLPLIAGIDRWATGARLPDLTLFFDLPADAARERGNSVRRQRKTGGTDRLDAEEVDFYRRVREGYLDLARQHRQRIRLIDSSGSRDETEEQVREILKGWLVEAE